MMQRMRFLVACGVTVGAGVGTALAAPIVVGMPTPATNITSITPYAGGGFYLFATGGPAGGEQGVNIGNDVSKLPWVSSFTLPTDSEAHGYGYASIGTPAGTFTTGTITGGTSADKFSFTLGAGAPSTFTIGVLVDNLNGTMYNASSLSVTPVGGVVATDAELPGNNIPDLYFFNVTGAASGDVIQIGATQGLNGNATIAGITFAVPEPASVGLLVVGAIGLLARRRRA